MNRKERGPTGSWSRDYASRGVHIDVLCSPDQVVDAARLLDEAGFCLESVTGVDWIKEEQMEVVYDYNRTDGRFCRVVVRDPRSPFRAGSPDRFRYLSRCQLA